MAVIDSTETSLLRPRLKFMLGELLLGSWRPKLLVADPLQFGLSNWPDAPPLMLAALPAEADGFLCRKVDARRFEPGIGVYGDFVRYVRYRDVLHYVEISGSFDDYLKRFSAKLRQNLTRSVRRFLKRDSLHNRCAIYATAAEMVRFQREVAAISQQTYQTRLLDAGLPADADFLQGMVAAAERGNARGYLPSPAHLRSAATTLGAADRPAGWGRDLEAELFAKRDEWRAVYILNKQSPPKTLPRLNEVAGRVTMLGGFLGRKGDGELGVRALWLGLQRVMDFAAGFRYAREVELCAMKWRCRDYALRLAGC